MTLGALRRGYLTRALALLRWSRAAAYVAVSGAGIVAVIYPPVSLTAADLSPVAQGGWAILMAISAGFCAWGAIWERWAGEYVGLIPLASVAVVFGIASLSRGTAGWTGGLFLIGFFWIMISRWQEVALLRAEADRLRKEKDGEGKTQEEQ